MADQLKVIKKEVKNLVENFTTACREAFGSLTADLERIIEKDLPFLTSEEKKEQKASEYIMWGHIVSVTAKYLQERISPDTLSSTPAFQALNEAHEKILLIQCELYPAYCDDQLESAFNKAREHQKQDIQALRQQITAIAENKETSSSDKVAQIQDVFRKKQAQMNKAPGRVIIGLFVESDELEKVLGFLATSSLPTARPKM